MTPEKTKKVLATFREILGEPKKLYEGAYKLRITCHRDKLVQLRQAAIGHAAWMCEEAIKLVDEGRMEKAMRWLGWINATVWFNGLMSLDDIKNLCKPEESDPRNGPLYDAFVVNEAGIFPVDFKTTTMDTVNSEASQSALYEAVTRDVMAIDLDGYAKADAKATQDMQSAVLRHVLGVHDGATNTVVHSLDELEIERVWVLSTSHVTQQEMNDISNSHYARSTEYDAVFNVSDNDEETLKGFLGVNALRIAHTAKSLGFSHVRLDRDGNVFEVFPTFDW